MVHIFLVGLDGFTVIVANDNLASVMVQCRVGTELIVVNYFLMRFSLEYVLKIVPVRDNTTTLALKDNTTRHHTTNQGTTMF